MSSLKTADETASTVYPSGAPSMQSHEEKAIDSANSESDVAIEEVKVDADKEATDTPLEKVDSIAAAREELAKVMSSDEGQHYPTGAKLGLVLLALCLSVFLVALDNTIIATAIPKITDEFNSVNDIGWYGSAYLLTTASFQLLMGRFYTLFSIKWVFLGVIFIFELGSLICGVAPNSTALIVGRAIAGIGSSGIFSGALIIIAYSVPLAKRPAYTGLVGAMYGIASVAGPLLGGVFTDKVTWRWCFYINLPIGGVALAVIAIFFTEPHRKKSTVTGWKERVAQFDVYGTIVFMPAIICLLLALQWGGTTYNWANARIIVLFILFGILISIFIAIQFWEPERATVNPRIISQRTVWASSAYAFCLGASFFLFVYYVPLWFQAVKGVSAFDSGIRNLPMVLSLVIMSLVAGGVITATGYYTPWMIAGTIVMSIGAGLITTWQPDTNHPAWIGYQIFYGFGVGMGMQQTMISVQAVLPLVDVPSGTAIIVFMQTLGGALFVSVGQNVFTNSIVSGVHKYAPGIDASTVLATGATDIQSTFAGPNLAGVTLAYNDALVAAFDVGTALAAASIIGAVFVEWVSVKGKKIEMGAA